MLTSTLTLSWSSLISTISPEKSANGPSLTRTVSPSSYSRRGLAALGGGVLALGLDLRGRSRRPCAGSGDGLAPWPTKPVTPGRVADDVPGVVVEVAAHEQVAGEHLLLDDDLLAVLELDDVLHRDDDLVDALLHVHRGDAGLEVLLDLLLVARLGVDHEPAARAVVGALDGRGRGLLEQVVLVERLGVGDARRSRSVGRRRASARRRRRLGRAAAALGGSGVVGVVGRRRRRRPRRRRRRPRRRGVVGGSSGSVGRRARRGAIGRGRLIASKSQRTTSAKTQSTAEDEGGQHDDGDEHDDRVVDDLGPGRPGDLAQLAAHLRRNWRGWCALLGLGPAGGGAGGSRRLARRARRRRRAAPWRCSMRFCSRFIAMAALSYERWRSVRVEQGRRDSNPQPPVLETGALPIELLPSGGPSPAG